MEENYKLNYIVRVWKVNQHGFAFVMRKIKVCCVVATSTKLYFFVDASMMSSYRPTAKKASEVLTQMLQVLICWR